MALSSNPKEAHISPTWVPNPKRASEQVGNTLQFTLLLDTGSSGGVGDPPRDTSQGFLAGTPRGTPRGTPHRSRVSRSVSDTANVGIAMLEVLKLWWCGLGCVPPFFLLWGEKRK